MALGIGQLLLGGLIGSQLGKGGLLGNDDEEEVNPQPQTQPTPTEQPSGGVFGGIGGMVSGISNQLFDGMSQEQVARLGMGFNSMRLNPSDNLAASFQTTINDSTTKRKLTKQTNATLNYLQNAVSPQYPNGRTDIIDMLTKGVISPTDAITMMNKKPSALAEKFTTYTRLKTLYGSADKIPPQELQLLGITQNEANSIEEYEYYKTNTKDEMPISYLAFLNQQTPTTNVTIDQRNQDEGNDFWKEYNKVAIPDMIAWENLGGSDSLMNLVKLKDALAEIQKPGSMITGPIISMAPDLVNAFINPGATDVRENIESVVQRNLKAVLGAQFTEKEGERLISRAFNPKLSPERNAKRLKLLIEQMQQAADAQNARLAWIKDPKNNSSFRGFDGATPNMMDMWTAIAQYQVGDIVEGRNGKRFIYQGGDDKSPSSFVEIKD
jgi:hypothetical protein